MKALLITVLFSVAIARVTEEELDREHQLISEQGEGVQLYRPGLPDSGPTPTSVTRRPSRSLTFKASKRKARKRIKARRTTKAQTSQKMKAKRTRKRQKKKKRKTTKRRLKAKRSDHDRTKPKRGEVARAKAKQPKEKPSRELSYDNNGISRLSPEDISLLFRHNKFLCIDSRASCSKICASRCIAMQDPVCASCKSDCVSSSQRKCSKLMWDTVERNVYRRFQTNRKDCSIKESVCKNFCRTFHCERAHAASPQCKKCMSGCPKAADAFCSTGTQLLKTYINGHGITNTIADVFGLSPVLCMDRVTNCTTICNFRCSDPRFKAECGSCKPDCSKSATRMCKYASTHKQVSRMYEKLKREPEKCRKGDRLCKSYCAVKCRHDMHSQDCRNCYKFCHMAMEPACTWGDAFSERFLRGRHSWRRNTRHSAIFRLNKFNCADKRAVCQNECEDKCVLSPRSYKCRRCTRTCMSTADIVCRRQRLDPDGTSAFNLIMRKPFKCRNPKSACIELCAKNRCAAHKGGKFSLQCLGCHKNCNLAVKAGCAVKKRTNKKHKGLYGELETYFKKKVDLLCEQCDSETGFICEWKCGSNYRCGGDCHTLAKIACFGACKRGYIGYYKEKFLQRYNRFFRRAKLGCNECSHHCTGACANECFSTDDRCKRECRKYCKQACSHYSCMSARSYYRRTIYSRRHAISYITKVIEVEMERVKRHQLLRADYDEEKVSRMRNAVYRENRDSIMGGMELVEEDLYKQQERLVKEQEKRFEKHENELMTNIKNLYMRRDEYEETKDSPLAIFED